MVQSIEDYSLWNISNRINLRPNFDPIYQVSCFFRWAMHHVSMYFQRKAALHFLLRKKRSCFRGKNTIFPDSTRKIICRHGTFWKHHIFRRSDENIIFPCIFEERSSFIFRLTCKIIFSGKRDIIFPDNTRKIVFQRNFLERPSFQDVWKRKILFSVQCQDLPPKFLKFSIRSDLYKLKNLT